MKKFILLIILFVSFSCEEKLENDTKTPLRLEISNLSVKSEVRTKAGSLIYYPNLQLTTKLNDEYTGIEYKVTFNSDCEQIDGDELYYEDLLPIGKYNYSIETIQRSKEIVSDQSDIEDYNKADYMISDETYLDETKKALVTNLKHINVAIEIKVSGTGSSKDDFNSFISDSKTVLTFIDENNDEIKSYKMNYSMEQVTYGVIVPVDCIGNELNFKLTDFNDSNKTVSGTCKINSQPKAGDKIVINMTYYYKYNSIETSEEEDISSWDNKGEWK